MSSIISYEGKANRGNYLFSIVIPYHANAATLDLLKRQLSYYNSCPIIFNVVVAVSGDEVLKKDLENFIKKLGNLNFSVLKTEEKDIRSVKSWIKKIADALQSVKTEYVALNGADDVLIPEQILECCGVLKGNLGIAAIKGNTVFFNKKTGAIIHYKDLPIMEEDALRRLKISLKDRDSIFYSVSRTKDILADYEAILLLSEKSNILSNSFYHVEHLKALRKAALGKIMVIDRPWRIQTSHDQNHESYTPASFLRVKLGPLKKQDYKWFQSKTNNLSKLGYSHYRFLWMCHQIIGINIGLKQIIFECLYKHFEILDFFRILSFYSLNRVYFFLKKKFFRKNTYGGNKEFILEAVYPELKKLYFTEDDSKLIESAR